MDLETVLLKEINDITGTNDLLLQLQQKKIIVLSGGGMKGIAHIGGLQALDDRDCLTHINTVAGTSIGALIGTLLVIGYTPREIYEFVLHFDIAKMGSI